ncbi:signal peptide peptidase SppA [Corallibacter sp.]|uniref:signal peptide peptidase SppA n=1 Tax=Corallibacter sp. TaxID=2038084 RepID=UPI003AB72A98
MNFLKRVLSTVVGIIVFLIISFFGLIFLGALFGSVDNNIVQVRTNSVLELQLDFPINDYAGKTNFKEYTFLNENEKNGLFNLIDAINYAATDNNIQGISITNNMVDAGISQVSALRKALLNFKESGKFIVAYADIYSQKDYYLSSVADTIYLNPAGMMEFKGLYSEQLYFKDFQEKTGVRMEVVRLGKYKSAVEPFLESEMSENNREQIYSYLNSLWSTLKSDISESRDIPVESLHQIADSLLARTPKLALKSGLIDRIGYYDEYLNGIKNAVGISSSDNLRFITIEDYAEHAATKLGSKYSKNKIAVIYAQGEIIYGEGDQTTVGQGAVNRALESARNDDRVKAVVLRVNSPGGSALASELIWREIELTKQVKPVIVSMGDLAASGGYYIASNANEIIAEPTTITGSIGVFGVLPNGKELADNLGINAEQVVTNKNAVTYSFFERLDDNQRAYIKEGVLDIYELFSTRVSQGRNLTREQVETIAQGRVWTGQEALNIGLVDQLGGLDLAIQRASEYAQIEDFTIKELPVFEKDLDKMLQDFGLVKAKETILKEEMGAENYETYKRIKALTQKKGIQLLFPYSTNIN